MENGYVSLKLFNNFKQKRSRSKTYNTFRVSLGPDKQMSMFFVTIKKKFKIQNSYIFES